MFVEFDSLFFEAVVIMLRLMGVTFFYSKFFLFSGFWVYVFSPIPVTFFWGCWIKRGFNYAFYISGLKTVSGELGSLNADIKIWSSKLFNLGTWTFYRWSDSLRLMFKLVALFIHVFKIFNQWIELINFNLNGLIFFYWEEESLQSFCGLEGVLMVVCYWNC